MLSNAEFDVAWGVVASLVISVAKKYMNLSSPVITYLNYILAGLGSFFFNWQAGQDWKQAVVGGVVSLFSSLGWYKSVGQPLANNMEAMKK